MHARGNDTITIIASEVSFLVCSMVRIFYLFHVLNCDAADILGSSIGNIEHVCVILEKVAQLRLMGDQLCLLHSHDALLILRHSFSIPKILYILRTAPCFLSPHIDAYDSLLGSLLSDIINVSLTDDSCG